MCQCLKRSQSAFELSLMQNPLSLMQDGLKYE